MTTLWRDALLIIATFPFIYYLLAIYSSWRFFHRPKGGAKQASFTPPLSNVMPIRGLDPEAFENLAAFCRQDYPDYEQLFCVGGEDEPVVPLLERLVREFPERRIRILFGSGSEALNDKAAKLSRLVREARYETLVISDSDVRPQPDYLRTVVAPLADPQVGAVTCFYVPIEEKTFIDRVQTVGMVSDFYATLMVGWQLEGVRFALGPTIATTRARLAAFGGYASIANRPGDDLLVGSQIADQGFRVELLPDYTIRTVPDYQSLRGLVSKRTRWLVVMRHLRPWGHLGLLLTQGLPWSIAAMAVHPSVAVVLAYAGTYLGLRSVMTWLIGVKGLRDQTAWGKMWLLPVWDALAFVLWLASFGRNTFRWRGGQYAIRDGQFVSATAKAAASNKS